MPKTSRKSIRKAKPAARKKPANIRKTAGVKRSAIAGSKTSRPAPFAALFPDLEAELATTRRMLERVPNGNDDWRPHVKSRSLGELASHLAQLPGFAMWMLTREEFDAFASRPEEPQLTTSADPVKPLYKLSSQRNALH